MKMDQNKIFYDVKFDGESLIFFDRTNKVAGSIPANIYKGLPEIVKRSGSKHTRHYSESESIVVNPTTTTRLTSTTLFGWYAKHSIMTEYGLTINTNWDVHYVSEPTDMVEDRQVIYVVASTKSPLYKQGMVPLLDTLIHIRQHYWGLTLKQIATYIKGEFDHKFLQQEYLLRYLFEIYREEMRVLCRVENTPITKLYQCDFNVTFDHDFEKENPMSTVRCIKHLKEVILIAVSSIFHDKTYGNIPWTMSAADRKLALQRDAKFLCMPLVYLKDSGEAEDIPDGIYYQDISIFPEVTLLGRDYTAGSSIGIVKYNDGTQDVVMRGELFDDTSVREQMIIMLMYDRYIQGDLAPSTRFDKGYRNIELSEQERKVRKELIEYIQDTLLTKI
jgi:hypothetical protein